jgi:hypothetical protein
LLELAAAFCGATLPVVAGYGIGRRLTRGIPLPETIRFACGTAALSVLLLVILLMHAGHAWVFALVGLGGAALIATDPPTLRLSRPPLWILVIAVVYSALYLLYALTPETQSDALNYHLSLSVAAAKSGGFADRVSFYEVLPQGMETLFAMAYSIGGEPGAKLVHLVFLALTVALMLAVAEELNLPAWVSWPAAILYAVTPVTGASSTTAYNDAGMTFYVLASFYLLALWWQKQNQPLLLLLGLCIGFCYAIKFSGGLLAPVALAVILWKRQTPWIALMGMAAVGLPWAIRAAVLTGNPFAPLLNRFFPNPHFHVDTEQALHSYLRDYGGVAWQWLPLEVTIYGDRVQGLLGPVWLLLPVALLALRRWEGRLLLGAAAVAAMPWLLNIGTRFLMPALPFLALALCLVVPRGLLPVVLAVHALFSWPQLIPLWARPHAWALHRDIPLAAAMRLEDRKDFLERTSYERVLSGMVESNTQTGDRVFDLANAPFAVTPREMVNAWQTALGERLARGLYRAASSRRDQILEWRSEFPTRKLSGIRVRYPSGERAAASIREIVLFDQDRRKLPDPNVLWSFRAWPNVWDSALVLDRNAVSDWMTHEPVRAGMFVEVEMPSPASIAQVRIVTDSRVRFELYGRASEWIQLPIPNAPIVWPELNLRPAAMRLLRRERITHILAAEGTDSFGAISKDMIDHPKAWGLQRVAGSGSAVLLRVNDATP